MAKFNAAVSKCVRAGNALTDAEVAKLEERALSLAGSEAALETEHYVRAAQDIAATAETRIKAILEAAAATPVKTKPVAPEIAQAAKKLEVEQTAEEKAEQAAKSTEVKTVAVNADYYATKWAEAADPTGARPAYDTLTDEQKALWKDAVNEGRDKLVDQKRVLEGATKRFNSPRWLTNVIEFFNTGTAAARVELSLEQISQHEHVAAAVTQLREIGFGPYVEMVKSWAIEPLAGGGAQVEVSSAGYTVILDPRMLASNDMFNIRYAVRHEIMHVADLNRQVQSRFSAHPDIRVGAYPELDGPVAAELRELATQKEAWNILNYAFDMVSTEGPQTATNELWAVIAGLASVKGNLEKIRPYAPKAMAFVEKALQYAAQNPIKGNDVWASDFQKSHPGESSVGRTQTAGLPGFDQVERVRPGQSRAFNAVSDHSAAVAAFERSLEATPTPMRKPLRAIFDTVANAGKKGLYMAVFGHDLADFAAKLLPAARKYVDLMGAKGAIYKNREDKIRRIGDSIRNVKDREATNAFIAASTKEQKWGFDPEWDQTQKADPEMAKRFKALSPEGQAAAKEIFRYGFEVNREIHDLLNASATAEFDRMLEMAQRRRAKDGKPLKEEAEIEKERKEWMKERAETLRTLSGPYAPLMREGKYAAVAKSEMFRAAEENNDTEQLYKLKADANHYRVVFTDSFAEASNYKREWQADPKFGEAGADAFPKEVYVETLRKANWSMLERIREAALSGVDNLDLGEEHAKKAFDIKRGISNAAASLYLNSLAETHARQARRHRIGVAGYEEDMMAAFMEMSRRNAHYIAALSNNKAITQSIQEMRDQAHKWGPDRADRMRLFNEFLSRHAASLNYVEAPLIGAAMQMTSMWMLMTSPAYVLTNLTQPFMMTLPMLSGQFSAQASSHVLWSAYRDVGKLLRNAGWKKGAQNAIDVENHVERMSGEKAMLIKLRDAGIIDIGMEQDIGEWDPGRSAVGKAWFQATDAVRRITRQAEVVNRVSSALAAYRLHLAKHGNKDAAVEYAGKVLRTTHGDYSEYNAPRIMQAGAFGGVVRLLSQFRKFQLIQLSLFARVTSNALRHESPEVRAVARKQLKWMLAHHAVLAGALGLPGANLALMLLGGLFGEDGEDDEKALRRIIGNETLADLLLNGAPTMAGVNLTGRIGAGNATSLMPFSSADPFKDRAGLFATYAALLGPFFGGVLPRFSDAFGYMRAGDYYKGLESALPKGLLDAMRAYRFEDEGVTNRKGDALLRPEELTAWDIAQQAVGFNPARAIKRSADERAMRNQERHFTEEASNLVHRYVKAYKNGDSAKLAQLRQEWMDLQESRARAGFKRQPMSTLIKAPMEQKKRERNVVEGVPYNRQTRAAAEAVVQQ